MDAYRTRFEDNSFNIITNRLGPRSYSEIFRVLKKGGYFFLFISDKEDWKEFSATFSFHKNYSLYMQLKLLKENGFKKFKIEKFSSVEYYRNIKDLARVIETIRFNPILNNKKLYSQKLREYENKYKTELGIKSSQKRVLIICKK